MGKTIQKEVAAQSVETVRASINERKFFESMKHLFASSYSVLGELMQNARRAGASRIDFMVDVEQKTATVQDDGCGVDDFNVLIALCESGWSEQVQLTDKPFGMGLFSLFFAAEAVTFRSSGRSLKVGLDDIINKRELVIQPDPETVGQSGTRIDLIGLKDKMTEKAYQYGFNGVQRPRMFAEIEFRAKGFPIPVFINGMECPRPHAQQSLHGVDTPIGFVSYPGVTNDAPIIPKTSDRLFYLQGLPIGRSSGHNEPIVVRPRIRLSSQPGCPTDLICSMHRSRPRRSARHSPTWSRSDSLSSRRPWTRNSSSVNTGITAKSITACV